MPVQWGTWGVDLRQATSRPLWGNQIMGKMVPSHSTKTYKNGNRIMCWNVEMIFWSETLRWSEFFQNPFNWARKGGPSSTQALEKKYDFTFSGSDQDVAQEGIVEMGDRRRSAQWNWTDVNLYEINGTRESVLNDLNGLYVSVLAEWLSLIHALGSTKMWIQTWHAFKTTFPPFSGSQVMCVGIGASYNLIGYISRLKFSGSPWSWQITYGSDT